MRPFETAGDPFTSTTVPSGVGKFTSLSVSQEVSEGFRMTKLAFTSPAKILPSATTGEPFITVPTECFQSTLPVAASIAFKFAALSKT